MSAAPTANGPFDLVLRGGRVVDPQHGLDRIADVAFSGGRVSAVADRLDAPARQVQDVSGLIVTPGLIDLHTHVYWGGTSMGVDAQMIAQRSGATTLVDAGSAGPGNFHGFRRHVIEPAPLRILAYLNISFPGIFAFSAPVMVGECTDLRLLDLRECVRVINEHLDLIVGVKVRVGRVASGNNGVHPLEMALEVAEEVGLPVMAHVDEPPPSRKAVISMLRPGDVLTHCFKPFPNAVVRNDGRIWDEVLLARERGVVFDLGHGGASFSFEVARRMVAHGFLPDALSSDVHVLSVDGPAHDLLVTMSKFSCLGVPIGDLVRMATQGPAQALRRPELGHLGPGAVGDATLLALERGRFEYRDCTRDVMLGDHGLVVRGRVVAGRWLAP